MRLAILMHAYVVVVLLWCCCGAVACKPVFHCLVYNEVLYFVSYSCLVGRSSGCVLDACSFMPNPFDVLFHVGYFQYQHVSLFY